MRQKVLKIIKKYFDILGGIVSAIALSIAVDWELGDIQLIYSVIILMLVLIGMFKVVIIKYKEVHHLPHEQEHNAIDKLIDNQKPMKAIRFSQHPTQDGEELGKLIIETTNGGWRHMLEWIKRNKGALISLLVTGIGILELVFNWCMEHISFGLNFNIIGIIIAVAGLTVAVLTSGFGSVSFKEALAQLTDQLNGDKTDLNHIKDIKYLERQVALYQKAVNTIEKEKEVLNKKYAKVLDDYRACQSLGLPLDETTRKQYEEYKVELKALQDKLSLKNAALETYNKKLTQLKESTK